MRKILFFLTATILAFSSCKKEEIIVEQVEMDTVIMNVTEYNPQFIIADQQEVTDNFQPLFLSSGDKVAICAPSNQISDLDISESIAELESWGLIVLQADNLYKQDGRYAGTLDERVKAFQQMIDDEEVRAIFMARGGYGAAQLLPCLDWSAMYASPKWIIGYSDITALHIALNNLGFNTIHGPMMYGFKKDKESLTQLKNMLFGQQTSISILANENCKKGIATGRLVGGNLSLIYAMNGTLYDLNTKNAILFIEDTGESNYSIDRMLLSLQQSGKLQELKGVVIGEFIGNNQGVDSPLNEIIDKYCGKLGIPVIYGIKSGHDTKNLPLMLGSQVTITVDDQNATIEFPINAVAK